MDQTMTIIVVYPSGTHTPLEIPVKRVKGIWAIHAPWEWRAEKTRNGMSGKWIPMVYRDGSPTHWVLTHVQSGYRLKNCQTLRNACDLQDLVHDAFPEYNHDTQQSQMGKLLDQHKDLWEMRNVPPLYPRGP